MKRIEKHHRRTIRLKGYDYSRVGAYFVTVCIQGKICLLGDIADGVMQMNDAGQMVEKWWIELNHKFDNVETDEYVVMPNHFHGIVMLTTANPIQDTHGEGKYIGMKGAHTDAKGAHTGAPLQEIMQWFKTMTTNEYIRGVKQSGWRPFPGRLWQRSYYDHIIRNEDELNLAREYIMYNPIRWPKDKYNVELLH